MAALKLTDEQITHLSLFLAKICLMGFTNLDAEHFADMSEHINRKQAVKAVYCVLDKLFGRGMDDDGDDL